MHSNTLDLTNKKYGRLTVLHISDQRSAGNQLKWVCLCDCGKIHIVTGESIRAGKSQSCGCLLVESRKSKLNRETALFLKLYSHIKTRYKKKYGAEDIIDFDSFVELSKSNCHYCGAEPSHIINDYRHDKETQGRNKKVSDTIIYYNGLDRIDSSIGYLKANVVTCCRRCNVAKLNYSYDEFKEWISKVYQNFCIKQQTLFSYDAA